ncbi:unnamed protein product [Absidia cylindrospora]
MNQLPPEILPLIVQNLEKQNDRYTCTFINKRFYLAANPLLWETANLCCNEPAQAFLTSLTTAQQSPGGHIRALFLNNWFWTDTDFFGPPSFGRLTTKAHH